MYAFTASTRTLYRSVKLMLELLSTRNITSLAARSGTALPAPRADTVTDANVLDDGFVPSW